MQMDSHDAAEYISTRMEDYLRQTRSIDPSRRFRCLDADDPVKHAHGDRNPSMTFHKASGVCKCWACGSKYNIYTLIAKDYNLPTGASDHALFKKACEIFDIQLTPRDFKKTEEYKKKVEEEKGKHADFTGKYVNDDQAKVSDGSYSQEDLPDKTEYFERCTEALFKNQYALNYLHSRGLSDDTIRKCHLGYDGEFKPYERMKYPMRAIVIPRGNNRYTARNLSQTAGKAFRYISVGRFAPSGLENVQSGGKPVYIVEGEFDRAALTEVGRFAISLGGTESAAALAKYLSEHRPEGPIVLALDNDPPGQEATRKLRKMLEDEGIRVFVSRRHLPDIFFGAKDANDALLKDPEKLKESCPNSLEELESREKTFVRQKMKAAMR